MFEHFCYRESSRLDFSISFGYFPRHFFHLFPLLHLRLTEFELVLPIQLCTICIGE